MVSPHGASASGEESIPQGLKPGFVVAANVKAEALA